MITVTGRLERIVDVGGESTGWRAALDEALEVEPGKEVSLIEVDPQQNDLTAFEKKRVRIRGSIRWDEGIERPRHPVLEAEAVEPAGT